MGRRIKYRSGYKYQLAQSYKINIGIYADKIIETPFLRLDQRGNLTIKIAYAWDGPSGPTFDTKSFMRGSLVHDAIYQLIALGLIDKRYRKTADKLLVKICKEDGMCWIRRQYVYTGVRWGGGSRITPDSVSRILTAP